MSREISYFVEGRYILIERFEDETDASYSERSSFILWFRNDPARFKDAVELSFFHAAKIFNGVTYNDRLEAKLQDFRDEATRLRLQQVV